MRRIAGSLGAEDGRFSGFGGFVLVRNGEDGFGGLGVWGNKAEGCR